MSNFRDQEPVVDTGRRYELELLCQLGKHKIYGHIAENHPRFKTLHFCYRELDEKFTRQEDGGIHRGHKIIFAGTITVDSKLKKVTAWDYDTDEMQQAAIKRKLNLVIEKIVS